MASFEVTEQAERDVSEILVYTLERWGEGKYTEYADLIEDAFVAVADDPARGRSRSAARPGVFGHHIKQLGHNARHVVFYRYDAIKDHVTVLRVLHDSMDFAQHLP
jgi:toxin ParE1/3/4